MTPTLPRNFTGTPGRPAEAGWSDLQSKTPPDESGMMGHGRKTS